MLLHWYPQHSGFFLQLTTLAGAVCVDWSITSFAKEGIICCGYYYHTSMLACTSKQPLAICPGQITANYKVPAKDGAVDFKIDSDSTWQLTNKIGQSKCTAS
jgi:hypothetical protein